MVRTRLLSFSSRSRAWWRPRVPRTPSRELGGCTQKWSAVSQDLQNVARPTRILVKDVQIDCNDIQLFADQAELFTDIDRIRATGNVVFVSRDSRIAAERMEFNTKTKTGTFYIASGIANLENRGVEPQPLRRAGARRLFLRRDDREARAQDLPDHARRLHHLRAADAALGDGRRARSPYAREARGPHQHAC